MEFRVTRLIALLAALVFTAASTVASAQGTDPANTLILETTKGKVVIGLRPDLAPNHVKQIKALAQEEFYDNTPFHRVIEGFMAQGGDPTGTGAGDSDKPDIKAEFTNTPFTRGTVGMARAQDPDSANSQFFICFKDASFLNGKYTVWGEVIEGMDVVDKLNRGEPPANPDKIVTAKVGG
jgi:peptidylprolyl isomerase